MEKRTENFITMKTFLTILGISFGVLGTLIGIIYNRTTIIDTELKTYKDKNFETVLQISKDVVEVKTNVANIQEILSGADIN